MLKLRATARVRLEQYQVTRAPTQRSQSSKTRLTHASRLSLLGLEVVRALDSTPDSYSTACTTTSPSIGLWPMQGALEDCDMAVMADPKIVLELLPLRAECKFELGEYKVRLMWLRHAS